MAVSSPETDEFSGLGTLSAPVNSSPDDFEGLGTPVESKDEFAGLGTEVLSPEETQREAQRASVGAVQALDVMAAPLSLDWRDAAEKADRERLLAADEAEARARIAEEQGSGTGPGSEAFGWRREKEFQLGQISPNTSIGRRLAAQRGQELSAIENPPPERDTTPSEALSGFLGPGLSATFQPVVDSAARNTGPAIGGALGAAAMTPTPIGMGARFLLPLLGGYLGSQIGGAAQETVLRTTETPEETAMRQERTAEDFERNPGLSRIGASVAQLPFFRPSLAQFGRAASGDRGAIMNLGIAGAIGGGMEVFNAAIQGKPAEAEDIAAGVFSNLIMNDPTRLGRRIGLHPSTMEELIDGAQKYRGMAPEPRPALESGLTNEPEVSSSDVFAGLGREVVPPTSESTDFESGLTSRGVTSTADVFAGVKPQPGEPNAQQISETSAPDGGVRAPEVTPENVPLPANEGGEGVQPSGQREPLAENAPEAPREVAQNVTSIRNAQADAERAQRGLPPMDEVIPVSNREMMQRAADIEAADPRAASRLVDSLAEKPRAIEPEEVFLLLRERTRLKSEYNLAGKRLIEAKEAGDESAVAAAQEDVNAASDALTKVEQATGRGGAGTQQGRALQARQAFAREDFSLAQMETDLRIDQGGAPLTEKQKAEISKQADTIEKTQVEMDRILSDREAAKSQAAEDAKVDPKVKSLADRIIARLDITAKNAATSLRSRLNNLGSSPDPLIVLDVAKIAAAKTAKKAIQFAQWSAEMITEFGEKVRPFLQAGWDAREQHIDSEVNSSVGAKTRKSRSEAEKQASAIKGRMTALANRTAKLNERTAAGDFSPLRNAPLDLSKNPEWVKLKAENDSAKAAYEKARYEARKSQRSTQQKIRDTVADIWSASRPLLASTDISAPGRQGIFFSLPDLFTNPLRLGRQLGKMFRSQFSEKKFQENEAAIKSRDNADLYQESGLYLADVDHKPSAREEQFKSELAEKIPIVGRIVRGSNRGFTAFMNTVRSDAMDAFVKWSGGKDKINSETGQFLAAAINDLTGRGNVSSRKAQGALEWLAKYLFSPRLWVSRFNTAILKPVWRDPLNLGISPRARAVVLGQYAKFAGALLALKWLAGLNGGKMEEDPRDSDFGKLQFGTKRYDVMGGIGNMVTLLSRIATQKTKADKGKLLRIAWQDEKRPERELGQILFNHLRNKAAPIPGAVYDYIYGRHPDRSKVTAGSILKQTTVPISVSDTVGYFQKDNPASALRDMILNAAGITVQDYRK